MKVHQITRGFWEHEPPTLTLGCKRLRPLAPKVASSQESAGVAAHFNIKSFIRPESGRRKTGSLDYQKRELVQAETQPGGTRWNPTQEQIGILEMLYRGGMRTPNAQQIEQITAQLGKYGKIEGKNVFYWFQNHKARERQKQKRNCMGISHSPRTSPAIINTSLVLSDPTGDTVKEEDSSHKRMCRAWLLGCREEEKTSCIEEGDRTLKLFPLHPEGR